MQIVVLDLPEAFTRKLIGALVPVGSRVTCNPAPTDTDQDILALVPMGSYVAGPLMDDGWDFLGSRDALWDTGDFESYRKGDLNLIVAFRREFHHCFLAATAIAKRLNVLDKADRIALFQAVMSGEICEPKPVKFDIFI